jgi:hypothetical protein
MCFLLCLSYFLQQCHIYRKSGMLHLTSVGERRDTTYLSHWERRRGTHSRSTVLRVRAMRRDVASLRERWWDIRHLLKSASLRNPDDRESSTSQILLIFLYVIGSSEVSTRKNFHQNLRCRTFTVIWISQRRTLKEFEIVKKIALLYNDSILCCNVVSICNISLEISEIPYFLDLWHHSFIA